MPVVLSHVVEFVEVNLEQPEYHECDDAGDEVPLYPVLCLQVHGPGLEVGLGDPEEGFHLEPVRIVPQYVPRVEVLLLQRRDEAVEPVEHLLVLHPLRVDAHGLDFRHLAVLRGVFHLDEPVRVVRRLPPFRVSPFDGLRRPLELPRPDFLGVQVELVGIGDDVPLVDPRPVVPPLPVEHPVEPLVPPHLVQRELPPQQFLAVALARDDPPSVLPERPALHVRPHLLDGGRGDVGPAAPAVGPPVVGRGEPGVRADDEARDSELRLHHLLERHHRRGLRRVPRVDAERQWQPVAVHEQPELDYGVGAVLLRAAVLAEGVGLLCLEEVVGAVVVDDARVPFRRLQGVGVQGGLYVVGLPGHHGQRAVHVLQSEWRLVEVGAKAVVGGELRPPVEDPAVDQLLHDGVDVELEPPPLGHAGTDGVDAEPAVVFPQDEVPGALHPRLAQWDEGGGAERHGHRAFLLLLCPV